jgi:hypothetical protein
LITSSARRSWRAGTMARRNGKVTCKACARAIPPCAHCRKS